jgi:RNA polymerase sigma factor (sigma-70 family)
MDREEWKRLLAEAPPRDARAADKLTARTIVWAEEQLQRWYPGKPADHREDIADKFAGTWCRVSFTYLAKVEPSLRESYLGRSLQRQAVKFFQDDDKRRTRERLFADISVSGDGEERSLDPDDLVGNAADPETVIIQRTEVEQILARVATMSAMNRHIFKHYFMEEKGETEVAHLLGVPVGTVSRHIHTIRVTLRKHLQEDA